ncbi:hypothetical protein Tco_1564065, partial [Tanacetum coccineum]
AYESSLIYKEKTKKIHGAKIKNREFHVGDRVLLFNSRLKLFSETGPFTVAQVFPYGTIELSQADGPNFKVNVILLNTTLEGTYQQRMPPKRTSTSEAPTMTQAAIKKLVADSVSAALKAQAANMANTDNTTRPREAPVARQCSYKEFMSCQSINFKGSRGGVGLIRWFDRTESVFSRSNCIEDCKVKFATGTLIEEALSCYNSFAQPIGIEEAYKIT